MRARHGPAGRGARSRRPGARAVPDRPLLLFRPEAQTRDVLALLRARGLNGVHAVELAPALLRARDWAGLKRMVFEENDGFWLPGEAAGAKTPGRLPPDSLVRLLRRRARGGVPR